MRQMGGERQRLRLFPSSPHALFLPFRGLLMYRQGDGSGRRGVGRCPCILEASQAAREDIRMRLAGL